MRHVLPPPGFRRSFDLQIIERGWQVKAAKANFFRLQAIGATLACAILAARFRRERFACSDSLHQHKLGARKTRLAQFRFATGPSIRGVVMKQQWKLAGLAALMSLAAHPALAQDKIKIGVIVTLSGPAAALGQQVRDGFALAVKDLGGKM